MAGAAWDRETLEKHSVDMRQFVDFRPATLADGGRIVEAHNSSGLTFSLLPDRGLDIWAAHYKGLPLTWISQGAPQPPDSGQPWLRQFNGGLLVTCGLTHAGPPETDDQTGAPRDIHGRYSRLRAQDVNAGGAWVGTGADARYIAELTGTVSEAVLFGEQLRLRRRYALELGRPSLSISDQVSNMGDTPAPLMLLYHFNFGYPLVRAGTELAVASQVYARNARAREGLAAWEVYEGPTPGFEEQVYFHHVWAGRDQYAQAALLNADFGLKLEWHTPSLPYLTQWKNTRQNIYVCGVEPGNCIPEGQNAARKNGRLMRLAPGETQTFRCVLTVLDGADAVRECREAVEALRHSGGPAAGCRLDDYAG